MKRAGWFFGALCGLLLLPDVTPGKSEHFAKSKRDDNSFGSPNGLYE